MQRMSGIATLTKVQMFLQFFFLPKRCNNLCLSAVVEYMYTVVLNAYAEIKTNCYSYYQIVSKLLPFGENAFSFI